MDNNDPNQPLNAEQIEELVKEVQSGKVEPYRLLVLHFQRNLHLYCHHMLGNRMEAEDAVQDVFLQCYRKIDQYRNSASFSAWLYKIAYHHCLNLIKQRKGQQRLLSFIKQQWQSGQRPPSLMVEDLLDGLAVEERQLVILRILEGRSFAEISEITGSPSTALRKKFERIKKKLTKKLIRKESLDDKQSIFRGI